MGRWNVYGRNYFQGSFSREFVQLSDTSKKAKDLSDFIPEFHDREIELERLVDGTRALSLYYLNELESLKDNYEALKQQALKLREAIVEQVKEHQDETYFLSKALEQFDEFMKEK